ncbi:MAG: YaiO family outer membrane beta-barrel protein [Bdellovibrionota bacterium]
MRQCYFVFILAVLPSLGRAAEYSDRASLGYSHQWISSASSGNQLWSALRHRFTEDWEALGKVTYLDRYGRGDGELGLGAIRLFDSGSSFRIETSFAPGADVLPRFGTEVELGVPIIRGLLGMVGIRYLSYSGAKAVVSSVGAELYLPNSFAISSRVFFSGNDFESPSGDRSSFNAWAGVLKLMYFFSDDARIWVYHGSGTEGFLRTVPQETASVKTVTNGGGAQFFFTKQFGVEFNMDWQERGAALSRFVTSTYLLHYRW